MKLSGSHLLSFGWLSQHRQKGIKRGSVTPQGWPILSAFALWK
jgi:hypothetical protein